MYRFRIGDYRVVFTANKEGNLVILLILRIAHRREVYR
ncbi:MAG: type II toxin-antitoxin system RelE/ParE family toxin [Patescibacteria group bacterium]